MENNKNERRKLVLENFIWIIVIILIVDITLKIKNGSPIVFIMLSIIFTIIILLAFFRISINFQKMNVIDGYIYFFKTDKPLLRYEGYNKNFSEIVQIFDLITKIEDGKRPGEFAYRIKLTGIKSVQELKEDKKYSVIISPAGKNYGNMHIEIDDWN